MSAFSKKAFLLAVTAALAGGSVATAEVPTAVERGPVQMGNPNASACAAGFTADPAAIDSKNPYGQSYTCTGPTIVCSAGFKAQDSVAGTIPAQPGQLLGQTIYGSPVTIKGGRMVYTCAEPPKPPS
jgi:hypothetical protein